MSKRKRGRNARRGLRPAVILPDSHDAGGGWRAEGLPVAGTCEQWGGGCEGVAVRGRGGYFACSRARLNADRVVHR
jgi:hypothetical protein